MVRVIEGSDDRGSDSRGSTIILEQRGEEESSAGPEKLYSLPRHDNEIDALEFDHLNAK